MELKEYTVTYCTELGQLKDSYDKTYSTLEEAQKRMNYLNTLSSEEILKELDFVPNWIRILHVYTPENKNV